MTPRRVLASSRLRAVSTTGSHFATREASEPTRSDRQILAV
eukprot:CAMPEP_0118915864 /NCGR_PEP_ID=MMETSP1166-20130328/15975_1 /TAXON_ID=1104430 /ORGANISM="Chrysoreinhardia sp, Strain CCMP3193" /LENGTH=40 /DNA_ID= /DNA_START= /DNA_END= /DNA_ORIENTATION=